MHLGIPGFVPDWLAGLKAIKAAHGERLGGLAGRRLTSVDLVYFVEDGSWYADCPVVFDFEGERVEICHQKFDDLSITWNTIDCSAPIGGWDEADFAPVWRAGEVLLGDFVGSEVREVALLEWRGDRDMADGMVAVEFVFETGRFAVANGLDENMIEIGARVPAYERRVMGRDGF
ncbi:hypothetical protein HDA40_007281 [Hamadaea flava]|uniref:Uncharacterized protein n=1 Tax=Hamadaea flava TaxID=1742688 RepID=A0ABV8LV47_9ACTN|nr:hypothetical protein [Hamadaea flava]MCP2328774.1 hypothetical protein [Hamadaea flava]